MLPINSIIQGDVIEVLKTFPDESIDCIITSPPYYGLRNYGVEGQIGLEPTLQEYLNKMFVVTAELKRVLKKTGTLWWNHGDSYGTGSGSGIRNRGTQTNKDWQQNGKSSIPGYEKSLLLQAHRLAIRMVDEQGYILRNTIIWHKPNCMPSSVRDRFTVDYEPVFFFTKSKKYFFEPQYEDYAPASDVRYRQALRAGRSYNTKEPYRTNTPFSNVAAKIKADLTKFKRGVGSVQSRGDDADGLVVGGTNPSGRNKRCVWRIPTKPYPEAHFATFPPALIEIPIKAGCPENGIVLDPFAGSGTTLEVARKLDRQYVGIELNKDYIKLAENRLVQNKLL